MKKVITLILVLICFTFQACKKTDLNGKLDGMWQLMLVEKEGEPGENKKETQIYYAVQHHLISLYKINDSEYLGRFQHEGDSLFLHEFRLELTADNTHLATEEELAVYGLSDVAERFEVETLTNRKMVLKSRYSRLSFRKF